MKIVLSQDQEKFFETHRKIIKLVPQQRFSRAIKKFSLLLGLALFSIFIPVLHFVLVPLFLILALVVGWKTYATEFYLELPNQNCIQCLQTLNPIYYLGNDYRFKCDKCHSQYLVIHHANDIGPVQLEI